MTAAAPPPPTCAHCPDPAEWITIYTGRGCDAHRPTFDPMTAVRILMAGWPGLAAAYVRTFSVLESSGWGAAA